MPYADDLEPLLFFYTADLFNTDIPHAFSFYYFLEHSVELDGWCGNGGWIDLQLTTIPGLMTGRKWGKIS